MTLKKYDQIMDHIEVTDAMRERIMDRVQGVNTTPSGNVIILSRYRRYLSIAACLCVLLAGAVMLPRILAITTPDPDPTVQGPCADIESVASAEELSRLVGFEITDIGQLPFDVKRAEYTSFWKELAEISYIGTDQSLTYRKSPGNDDNSGIYATYDQTLELPVNDSTALLQGTGGRYQLAVWSDETYSYSLYLDTAVSQEVMADLIAQIR